MVRLCGKNLDQISAKGWLWLMFHQQTVLSCARLHGRRYLWNTKLLRWLHAEQAMWCCHVMCKRHANCGLYKRYANCTSNNRIYYCVIRPVVDRYRGRKSDRFLVFAASAVGRSSNFWAEVCWNLPISLYCNEKLLPTPSMTVVPKLFWSVAQMFI